uniref:Uncharacterized protein n=1 Tax=Anguilla anguilla TaxID=7936 RepID=A0A0E9PGX8_ANGAN
MLVYCVECSKHSMLLLAFYDSEAVNEHRRAGSLPFIRAFSSSVRCSVRVRITTLTLFTVKTCQ